MPCITNAPKHRSNPLYPTRTRALPHSGGEFPVVFSNKQKERNRTERRKGGGVCLRGLSVNRPLTPQHIFGNKMAQNQIFRTQLQKFRRQRGKVHTPKGLSTIKDPPWKPYRGKRSFKKDHFDVHTWNVHRHVRAFRSWRPARFATVSSFYWCLINKQNPTAK